MKRHRLGYLVAAPVGVVLAPRVGVQPDLVYISNGRADIITPRGVPFAGSSSTASGTEPGTAPLRSSGTLTLEQRTPELPWQGAKTRAAACALPTPSTAATVVATATDATVAIPLITRPG